MSVRETLFCLGIALATAYFFDIHYYPHAIFSALFFFFTFFSILSGNLVYVLSLPLSRVVYTPEEFKVLVDEQERKNRQQEREESQEEEE